MHKCIPAQGKKFSCLVTLLISGLESVFVRVLSAGKNAGPADWGKPESPARVQPGFWA